MFKNVSKLFVITVLIVSLSVGFSEFNLPKVQAGNEFNNNHELDKELKDSTKLEDIFNSIGLSNEKSSQTIIITDRDEINMIAEEQSLENPDSIEEIRFDDVPFSIEKNVKPLYDINPLAIKTQYHIENKRYLGGTFTEANNYSSSVYDGPADVKKVYKKEDTFALTGSLGMQFKSVVELEFGVTLGKKKTMEDHYSFSVPAGYRIELRVFTTYHKYSYEIWNLVGGLDYNLGTDYYREANGLRFQQVKRKL